MGEGKILHVTVVGGRADEIQEVQKALEDDLSETGDYETVVFSDEKINLSELPVIDEYIEEIAERVVDKIKHENGKELVGHM